MFPIETISSIKWTAEYAARLRALRGKTSRREILKQLADSNHRLSAEGMRLLEDGIAATITPELFVALCNIYSVHPSAIVPCVRIGIPEKVSTNFQ